MHSLTPLKPAMAMIELIFAIVIIGFTLMGAPTLISMATTSATIAYQQESITIAASHTSNILTYAWDEKNTETYWQDILVTGGDSDLKYSTGQALRDTSLTDSTLINARSRRFNITSIPPEKLKATEASSFGLDTNETTNNDKIDDLDDWKDDNLSLKVTLIDPVSQASNDGEFIDQDIKLVTDIIYSNDTAGYNNASHEFQTSVIDDKVTTNTTNIKFITTTLTSRNTASELKKKIIMHAFLCNIGAISLEQKTF